MTTPDELWLVPVSSIAIVLASLLVIRAVGLRSLSKMSCTDFVVTVAIGSVIASVAASGTSLINGSLAIASMLSLQALIAYGRRRWSWGEVVDNTPLLLMDGPRIDEAALSACRVTRSDLLAKLREANVTHLEQVLAVVLESTGDVSVLHGDGPLEPSLLDGVRRHSDT